MDGSGEARRGVRRDPEPPAGAVIRTTRPLTYPLNARVHHNQGRKVEPPNFWQRTPQLSQGTLLRFR
jgi:hypothetical protein